MAGSVWLWDGKACRRIAGRPAPDEERAEPDGGDAVIIAGTKSAERSNFRVHRDRRMLVLNARAPVFAEWEPGEAERRVRRAGAACMPHSQQPLRRFEVSLFQLLPLSVMQSLPSGRASRGNGPGSGSGSERWGRDGDGNGSGKGNERSGNVNGSGNVRSGNRNVGREIGGRVTEALADAAIGAEARVVQEQDARYRPIVRLAARALHACGLDNGIVELAEDEAGKCCIAGIRLPSAADYRSGVWREAAEGLAARLQAAEDGRAAGGRAPAILLGADPEFLLLAGNGKVVSAARYLAGGHGAGCDAIVVGGAIKRPIAELRPAPSPSPDGLARNIRGLLQQAARRIPDQPPLRWAAGGMPAAGFALGGHIHISGVPLTGRLLRQLDSYVAFPLAMIETPSEQARRPRYGALGDFRLQPHGGFEYRTLPSWLASPLAAKAAFALALLCARETGVLEYAPAEDDRLVAAYYAGDRAALAGCMDGLAASMASTESYAELGRWIEPLLQAIRQGRTWDAAGDFRAKWGIGTPAK